MRILVVNPNTSATATARIAGVAVAVASDGTEIEAVSAPSGISAIETAEQSHEAGKAVARLIAERSDTFDAAVIAAFSDAGIEASRASTSCPVVGMVESALLSAAAQAPRFSIVTMGATLTARIREIAARTGTADRLVNIRMLPWSVEQASAGYERHLQRIEAECRLSQQEDEVGAIVLGSGPLSGLASRIDACLPIPVLDGVACAVTRAEHCVREAG